MAFNVTQSSAESPMNRDKTVSEILNWKRIFSLHLDDTIEQKFNIYHNCPLLPSDVIVEIRLGIILLDLLVQSFPVPPSIHHSGTLKTNCII